MSLRDLSSDNLELLVHHSVLRDAAVVKHDICCSLFVCDSKNSME
jgi:hypothetical protein